ncbi:periplasmic binding protein-like II [Anaeromyces robustus]|uniref:Periplasmic binding protein-like II n=1 Tax=Anaeromyces robustus TaxID=1754192 RepID=A0A1Y1WDX0_9FUNG|nr:periplasmic binding protein-like II [Anaeromyces robustus]|eukprot:ORX71729.1 periplasmic binding protein-like II [Anaeromyces robustus]
MVYSDKDDAEYGNRIRQLFDEKSTDYDAYFFNIHHTFRFVNDLSNLRKILSIYTLANYSDGATYVVGYDEKKDKLVGIPFIAEYGTLYYNQNLLNQYNKEPPTTWEELFEIVNYIGDREKSKNNNNFIGYLGNLPPNSYTTIDTIQELVYSTRGDKDDLKMPDYTSDKSKEVLSNLKSFLDKGYSKKEDFRLTQEESIKKIKEGNVLFARVNNFNTNGDKNINFISLPGSKKDIKSSCVSGYNIGVPEYISEQRQKKISLVFDYILREEVQAYIVSEQHMYSSMKDLYKSSNSTEKSTTPYSSDINVCENVDCDFLYNLQFYDRPVNYYENYDEYVTEYNYYIDQYFFNDTMKLDEAFKSVDDLTRNYYVEPTSKHGILMIVILVIVAIIMITSYTLMYNSRFNVCFVFMNNTYWGVFLFGTIFILLYNIVSLGEMNQQKCNLRFILLSLGVPISFSPLLLRLIVLYPESNKISEHINRNFSNYLCCHVLFELLLCTLYLLAPFDVTNHLLYISDNRHNFQTCECKSTFNKILLVIDIFEKGLEIFIFAVMIFAEWNIKATKSDIVSITLAIIFDVIAFMIYAVFYFAEFTSRFSYYWVKCGPVLLFGLSNFILVYVWKFINSDKEKLEMKEAYITKKTNTDNMKNITRMSLINEARNCDSRSSGSDNFINKIIKCHYEGGGNGVVKSSKNSANASPDGSSCDVANKNTSPLKE